MKSIGSAVSTHFLSFFLLILRIKELVVFAAEFANFFKNILLEKIFCQSAKAEKIAVKQTQGG